MFATRLMLVELIRVVVERVIHLVLFDFDSFHIHVEVDIHSIAGDVEPLYNAAAHYGWESDCVDKTLWISSNPSQSNTTIYKEMAHD